MSGVRYEGIEKRFEAFTALHALNLDIPDRTFLALLGPSGCGKTTALRILAGLETPTAGKVMIGERDVTRLQPRDRDVAMVFQSYALYPHMTIADNIGINMDPSHFWWQGIDPLTVIERLGDRIGYSHGKDTLVHPDRVRRDGVLHFAPPAGDPGRAPWHFAAVGEGHDTAIWTELIGALQAAGYDDVISIEHEDPRYRGTEGTGRSLDGLKRAMS